MTFKSILHITPLPQREAESSPVPSGLLWCSTLQIMAELVFSPQNKISFTTNEIHDGLNLFKLCLLLSNENIPLRASVARTSGYLSNKNSKYWNEA